MKGLTVRLKADTTGIRFAIVVVAASVVSGVSGFSRTVDAQQSDLDPRIEKLVASVSEDRLTALLTKLESFGTRNTMSSTDSPATGIGAARQCIFDEMKSYSPRLQVSFDTYRVAKQGRITRDVEIRNVMAVLPGRSPRRIYVSGHYDTIAIRGGQSGSNSGSAGRDAIQVSQPADPNAPHESPPPGRNHPSSRKALTL